MIKGPGKLKLVYGEQFSICTFILVLYRVIIVLMFLTFFIFYFSIEGKDGTTEMEVFNFTGDGGVALSMYNTDEVSANHFLVIVIYSLILRNKLFFFSEGG